MMKAHTKSLLLICMSILFTELVSAQSFHSHPVALTPKKREVRPFNDSLFRIKVYERYREKFSNDSRLNEFTEIISESAKDLFTSNEIYTNIDQETEYLKTILQKTIPESYLDKNVKLYIVRDPSVNAYCREDGSMFIHVGLLSVLDSEAELAAILSHEFGHYYYKHSIKRYKKEKNAEILNSGFGFFGFIGAVAARITTYKFFSDIRAQEKQCDLFAVKFFKENQYASGGIVGAQEKLMGSYNIYKRRNGYQKYPAMYRTHPSSEKRISLIKQGIKRNDLQSGVNFKVDSAAFLTLKKRCTDETIYLHFSNGDFDACIERAYLNHIYMPYDEFYTYFVLESLRRKTSLFPATKNDNFITSDFNLKARGKSSEKRESLSIHKQLTGVYDWEMTTYARLNKPSDSALLDPTQVEFVTNAEALTYFSKLAEDDCESCYPSLKQMDKHYSRPDGGDEKNELEQSLYEQTFLTGDVLKPNNKQQCLPIFFNNFYSSVRGKKSFYVSSIPVNSGLGAKLDAVDYSERREDPCSMISYIPEMDFRESYQINSWLNLMSQKIIFDSNPGITKIKKKHIYKGTDKVLTTMINVESDFPELLVMCKKYNFKKVYFADITRHTVKGSSGVSPGFGPGFGILIYCLELNTNKLSRYSYQFMPVSMSDLSGAYGDITNSIMEVLNKTRD